MRRALPALMVAGAVSAAVAMPAAAREFPYCIKGCDFGAGTGDCSFSSLAQCQATASGRDASCAANPYFNEGGNADRSQPPIPKEILMRILALTILAVGAASAAAPAQAQTYDPRYPVCLHVYGRINYYECAYTSLPQCNMSASGRAAQCVINPYFAHASQEPSARRYKRYRNGY